MIITRPYNAEDNEINMAQREILINWAKKNNEEIKEISIYGACVTITTDSGRELSMNESQGCRSRYQNVRSHLYMQELIDGKYKRIKKENW